MIKRLIANRINNYLIFTNKKIIANSKPLEQSQVRPKQPYEILLNNSIENTIKFPSHNILKGLKSRNIARVMAANHNLKNDADQVLQAHIECLYSLAKRVQPSIQAIVMFTEKVYQSIDNLAQAQLSSPSLLNLLKPTVVLKIAKICQLIDPFYNQSIRGLLAALIVKLLQKSAINEREHIKQMKKLGQQYELVKKGEKLLHDQKGNQIKKEYVEDWFVQRQKQINENHRYLNDLDYWTGFQLVTGLQYYTEPFLLSNTKRLEQVLEKDPRGFQIEQVIIKIKCILSLQKFKNHHQQVQRALKTLNFSYNRLVEQYFKVLSNQRNIIEIMNSSESTIQANLLTVFLTNDHYQRAKKVYLQIFKTVFNIYNNGVLLLDVKRLRGIFQLVLILYTHEDTKQIHQMLAQFEKITALYPLDRFNRIEAHYYLAQKYGYKSDYLADAFFKELIQQKEKLERNKGHIHSIHQISKELQLAKKLLIYKNIALKPAKEQLQKASSLAHSLFDANVWYCLAEISEMGEYFLTSSSYSHQFYFHKAGLVNISLKSSQRKKIQSLHHQMGLKNINKQYGQVLEEMRTSNKSSVNIRLNHLSNWQHNPHARMRTLLELANHSIQYLKRKNYQQANHFIQQFLSQTVENSIFYNALKQKFAYPQIINQLIQLMSNVEAKALSIQSRDIEAIKRMYHSQLLKILKSQVKPSFVSYYQQHVDLLQFNRVMIPFDRQVYGLSNIAASASYSLLLQAMRRFQKQKDYFKMQIETFLKFNKGGDISIETNYLQFPHLADVKIKGNNEESVILFESYEGQLSHFLNSKQLEMLKSSQAYWISKSYLVNTVRCQRDLQNLIKRITKVNLNVQK